MTRACRTVNVKRHFRGKKFEDNVKGVKMWTLCKVQRTDSMNQQERETIRRLFNTAFTAKESSFTLYPKLVSLQLKNGVKMGGQCQ